MVVPTSTAVGCPEKVGKMDIKNSYFVFNPDNIYECCNHARFMRRKFIDGLGCNAPTLYAGIVAAHQIYTRIKEANPLNPIEPLKMPPEINFPRQQDFLEQEQWFERQARAEIEKPVRIADAIRISGVVISPSAIKKAIGDSEILSERLGTKKKSPLLVYPSELLRKWGDNSPKNGF